MEASAFDDGASHFGSLVEATAKIACNIHSPSPGNLWLPLLPEKSAARPLSIKHNAGHLAAPCASSSRGVKNPLSHDVLGLIKLPSRQLPSWISFAGRSCKEIVFEWETCSTWPENVFYPPQYGAAGGDFSLWWCGRNKSTLAVVYVTLLRRKARISRSISLCTRILMEVMYNNHSANNPRKIVLRW